MDQLLSPISCRVSMAPRHYPVLIGRLVFEAHIAKYP